MRPHRKKDSPGKRRPPSHSNRAPRDSQRVEEANTSGQPANMPPTSVQELKIPVRASDSEVSVDGERETAVDEGSPECPVQQAPPAEAGMPTDDVLEISPSRIRCRRNAIDPSTYVHPFPPPDNGT